MRPRISLSPSQFAARDRAGRESGWPEPRRLDQRDGVVLGDRGGVGGLRARAIIESEMESCQLRNNGLAADAVLPSRSRQPPQQQRGAAQARGQAQEAPTQRRGPQAEVDRRRLVYRHGQRDVRRWTGGDAAAASCQLPLPRAHNKATRQAAHSQEKYTNTSRHPVVSLSASVSTASRQCRPGRCVCRPSPCPAFFVRRPRRRWHRLSDCPCDCDSRKSLSWQNLLQNGRETAPASAPTHPARGPSR